MNLSRLIAGVAEACRRNWVFLCFLIFLGGHLSLSFLGQANKSVREVSILLILIIVFRRGVRLVDDWIVKAFGLYFLCCAFSLLFSDDLPQSIVKLLELFFLFVFLNEGVRNFQVLRGVSIFHVFTFYCVVQTFVAFLGYFFDPAAIPDKGWENVTFLMCNYPPIHANSLGSVCAYAALASITLSVIEFRRRGWSLRCLLWVLCGGVSAYTLYLTNSRISMIGFLLALLWLSYRLFDARQHLVLGLAVVTFCGLNASRIEEAVSQYMLKTQSEDKIEEAEGEERADALTSGRVGLWLYVLSHPERWILGQGYATGFQAMWRRGEVASRNAHNSMVEILYNSGIFALFFWLLMWWSVLKRYFWLVRRRRWLPMDVAWLHFAFAVFICALVRSFANVFFVYLQLETFAAMGVVILFVYCTIHVRGGLRRANIGRAMAAGDGCPASSSRTENCK